MDLEYYSSRPNPVSADAPNVPEVRARRFLTTRTAALFHVNGCPDEARNCWVGATELTGNSTPFKVWKLTPQGSVTHVATVWPTDGHKTDSAHMRIVWEAVTAQWILLIFLTTHQAISGERDNDYQVAELRGLGVAAPATGEGVEFDSRAIGVGQEPGGEPIDYARVAREVANEIQARMNGELGQQVQQRAKNGARQGIATEMGAGGVLPALIPAYLRTPDSVLQVWRDGLAPFTRDRAFEGATEALKKAGLPPKE